MDYRAMLQREFDQRRSRNRRYSLRAFAQQLEVSPADLSKVMAKKKPLSPAKGALVAEKLFVREEDKEAFLESVLNSQVRRLSQRAVDSVGAKRKRFLDQVALRDLHEWFDFAVPLLAQTENFVSDPEWIAQRLGITLEQAQSSIKALLTHGLLVEESGGYRFNVHYLTTANKTQTNFPLQKYQQTILGLSSKAVMVVPIESRSHNSVVLAIDPSKIPLAKQKIQKFLKEMSEFLETDPRSEVYQMHVGLFPLTRVFAQVESITEEGETK